ncbi:hypothetical protein [Pisciglobus halotolerans]|uniref:Uncharacterized protein n=1 Tax=Pisciglobus halotolerans TaxID=745365 RepID=A0A1I3AXL7_9LACT|nr:hypothetical protein [Pisciglobus halotolerans]SFH54773.1 hypothetical protein SAMN04489868_10299 [Pisciglobus halotolerans]
MKFIIIVLFILFVLSGVGMVHFLQKKGIFINRWIFGLLAFLIVLIPALLFNDLPQLIKTITYILSGLFAVMFFETGRLMLERNEVKGIVRAEQFSKAKKG